MSGFNIQELMSQAKQQYEVLQKKMQETVVKVLPAAEVSRSRWTDESRS